MKDLKLTVVTGKHAGKEITVSRKKFLIGRAEDCHLRPNSELISRHHCAIIVEERYIAVRDFGSKNGTYVNADRISGEQQLKIRDRVKIGPVVFEVHWTEVNDGAEDARVVDMAVSLARAAAASSNIDVGQCIYPQSPRHMSPTAETQRISLNEAETTQVSIMQTGAYTPPKATLPEGKKSRQKSAPQKARFNLISAKDSQDAAAQMLAKLRRQR